jgi:hypothetical protein
MSFAVDVSKYEKVERHQIEEAKVHRRFTHHDTNDKLLGSYETSRLINVIIALTRLQEIAQREDGLKKQLRVQREQVAADSKDGEDKAQIQNLEEEMKGLQRKWWHQEQELFRTEQSIPSTLRERYRSVQQHPKSYMNPLLTEDCTGRGGCCSRECGCCWKRPASSQRRKAFGHCTVECECCIQNRGFELTEEEKEQNRQAFEDLLWGRSPWYALAMAVGYFVEPKEAKPKESPPPYSAPKDTVKDVS